MNVLKKIFPISGAFSKGAGKTAIGCAIYTAISFIALFFTLLLRRPVVKVLTYVLSKTAMVPLYIIAKIHYWFWAIIGLIIFLVLLFASGGVLFFVGWIVFVVMIIIGLIPTLILNGIATVIVSVIVAIPALVIIAYCVIGVIVSIVACISNSKAAKIEDQ